MRRLRGTRVTEQVCVALLVLAAGAVFVCSGLADRVGASVERQSPPDQLLFVASRVSGTAAQLFVMNSDGTDRHRLVTGSSTPAAASWAPDGQHVAFVTLPPGPGARQGLFVMKADGSQRRRLAIESYPRGVAGTVSGISYAWSPGGDRIACSLTKAGRARLFIANLGGNEVIDLTPPEGKLRTLYYEELSWSPDGRWIGFSRFEGQEGTRKCCSSEYDLMHPSGAGLHRLIWTTDWVHDAPVLSWAPSGASLAVVTDGFDRRDPALSIVEVRSGHRRRLPGFHPMLSAPTWSPDSSRFAFSDLQPRPTESGRQRFLSIRATDARPRTLNARLKVALAQWKPDGRQILLVVGPTDGDMARRLVTIPSTGGEATTLARVKGGWAITWADWRPAAGSPRR
jgi:Tol biopolymer transport system component